MSSVASAVKLAPFFYKKQNLLYAFCRHRFWIYFKNWVSIRTMQIIYCALNNCGLLIVRSFFSLQVLRVQSPEGTKRIEILPSATMRDLYEQIHNAFQLDGFAVYRERNYTKELASSRSQTIEDHNLKHGDMIYLKIVVPSSSSVIDFCAFIWSTFSSSNLFPALIFRLRWPLSSRSQVQVRV